MSRAGVSQAAPDHANVIHHRRKIMLVLWVKLCSVDRIPIHSTRGAFRRRLAGGERERHLRAMEDATSSPGRTRVTSSATMSRPGPTTVKGIKAKMPRWRAARRGGAPQCTSSSGVIRTSARSNPGIAPCRRADPLALRDGRREECGRPPGPKPQTGADFLCVDFVGWAKALARHFPDGKDSRAPCPRCHNSQLRKNARARRTTGFDIMEMLCQRLCPPYDPVQT